MNVAGVEWTPNPDGEYNEHTAEVRGKKVTIYSDRDESQWAMYYGDDSADYIPLDATALHEAAKEAQEEARRAK